MQIPATVWLNYINRLRKVQDAAGEAINTYLRTHQLETKAQIKAFLDFCYNTSTYYGEGATEIACEMYEAIAELSGIPLTAVPARTASYGEVAKAVQGTMKTTENADALASAVGRLVKTAGVDTTMQNALKDGAEWAWIPVGDTCPFCLTLASQGWQKASKAAIKGGHAEHIHNNCDCTYAIRFNHDTTVEGYNPKEYRRIYDNAEGRSSKDKINALRREAYAENKDEINAQKRDAYAKRKELEDADEIDVGK